MHFTRVGAPTTQEAQVRNTHAEAKAKLHVAATRLGWFSIALGAAEVLMPKAVGRATGAGAGSAPVFSLHGLREIGIGIGLLTGKNKAAWLAARLAGDAVDMATLSKGVRSSQRAQVVRAVASMVAVAGITVLDAKAARQGLLQARQTRAGVFDYSDRVGFARPPEEMRGAAAMRPARAAAHADGVAQG